MRRYHTQQYVNGTKCDLNSKQRKTEVRVSSLLKFRGKLPSKVSLFFSRMHTIECFRNGLKALEMRMTMNIPMEYLYGTVVTRNGFYGITFQ